MAEWFENQIFLVVWGSSIIATAMIGSLRLKESPVSWGIAGAVLGPFAVLWALLKKPPNA